MILPPVGINLFVIQGIARVPLGTVVRGIAPFAAVDVFRLFLLCVFPWLATWLPSRMIHADAQDQPAREHADRPARQPERRQSRCRKTMLVPASTGRPPQVSIARPA